MNRSTLITLKTSPGSPASRPPRSSSTRPSPTRSVPTPLDHHAHHRLQRAADAHPFARHHAAAPLFPRLSWLIKFRRLLGLFAFFYASLHLATYVALYMNFDLSVFKTDITKRRFIIMGFSAYLLLAAAGATSTTWAIRKLGGKRWNRLHKLVYFAAICGIIHYWWQVKPGVLTPAPHDHALCIAAGAACHRVHAETQSPRRRR